MEEKKKKLAFELDRAKLIVEYECPTEDHIIRAVREVINRLATIAFPDHSVTLKDKEGV